MAPASRRRFCDVYARKTAGGRRRYQTLPPVRYFVTKNDFHFSLSYSIIRADAAGRRIATGPRWSLRRWSARSARKWGMAGGARRRAIRSERAGRSGALAFVERPAIPGSPRPPRRGRIARARRARSQPAGLLEARAAGVRRGRRPSRNAPRGARTIFQPPAQDLDGPFPRRNRGVAGGFRGPAPFHFRLLHARPRPPRFGSPCRACGVPE